MIIQTRKRRGRAQKPYRNLRFSATQGRRTRERTHSPTRDCATDMRAQSRDLCRLALTLLGILLCSSLAFRSADATSTFMYGTLRWKPVASTSTKVSTTHLRAEFFASSPPPQTAPLTRRLVPPRPAFRSSSPSRRCSSGTTTGAPRWTRGTPT